MIVRKTRPEESRRINELFAICFEFPYANCPIADPETDPDAHWAAYTDEGEIMSNFTIPDYTIHFDGHSCKMAGIGGVATLPQYRRQGGIRACFEAALPDLYQNGYDFSYLYPFSTRFYRQFGYECCVQKYLWQVDLQQLAFPNIGGSFRLAEKGRPLTDAIRSIDRVWESHFNMMVQHTAEDYKWTEEADPAVKQVFTYVWFDAAGTPKAYATFKAVPGTGRRDLECSRFCFADKEGFRGLLQLFKSLAADHTYVRFYTPALPSLQYLMNEWSLGAVKWELLANAGMVRVIHVPHVLEKAACIGSGQVTLEIHDPQIPENTGCFIITFADGKVLSVAAAAQKADVVMDISTFSALIAGVWDWEDAKHTFSGLTVHNDVPALRQIFYRKPMMIVDAF